VLELDTLMILDDEYREPEKEREAFAQENKFSRSKSAAPTPVMCRRFEESGNQDTSPTPTETAQQHLLEADKHHIEARRNVPCQRPAGGMSKIWWERTVGSRMSEPTCVVLLGMRQSRCQERQVLPTSGNWPQISAAGGRAGVAQCYLSKLTGKQIMEEQQLSAADEG